MRLEGKRALVTGAAIRVGRAIAEGLADRGMNLALHYFNNRDEAVALAESIRGTGREARVYQADFSMTEGVERFATEVEADGGPVDVLILSAAVYPREELSAVTAKSTELTLRANLVAPLLLAKRIGLEMKKRGRGAIVTLLDWSIDRPDPCYLPYQISKAGLREATYGLARALAPEVTVNGIAPGAVLLPAGSPESKRERIVRITPLQKLGNPEDIVRAVVYLLEGSEFLTGTIIKVDGGRSLR